MGVAQFERAETMTGAIAIREKQAVLEARQIDTGLLGLLRLVDRLGQLR